MKNLRKYILVFIIFLFGVGLQTIFAQNINAFARVSLSPREGVVRQPYKVTITVYSSTWFAEPLRFANLRIDDAFIIPFTRTVSGINYINNKKYATLTFYYLVFPYNTGKLEIPELEINASIPPEGDYKGQPVTIRTKPQILTINPVPSSKEEPVWMVAKNVKVSEEWDKPLEKLKVGDVLVRKITITANGTLPSLIQPLEVEKPEGTSIYPKEPDLQDRRNNTDVNGVRMENYSYLFEIEGNVNIPKEEVVWWNPQTKRVYKRTLPERKLTIAPNPDLDLMESLKDSLLAMTAPQEVEAKKASIPWLKIGIIVIAVLIIFLLLYKLLRSVIHKSKERRRLYLHSELYHFKKVKHTLNHKTSSEFIRELYIWFDLSREPHQTAALSDFLDQTERELLEQLLGNIYASKEEALSGSQKVMLNNLIQKLRKSVLYPDLKHKKTLQLNPV